MLTRLHLEASQSYRERSHQLIPGGCHTYAKGEDQYPLLSPAFLDRGEGCHVWDVDGNEYIEYGMGCRAVTLGHAYMPVVEAAYREMRNGANFTRPARIEVECAETFLSLIDADMVKFCKNGSDATTAAIRLARAWTGREMIACCADHPFFSVDDWFMASTPVDAGIPAASRSLIRPFRYNELASVESLFNQHPNQIAALILEPEKYDEPHPGYLQELKRICHRNGTVFILDEMITGFRWHLGGGQAFHDVKPDLCTFGKALANGFSVAALAGRRDIMELGGLKHDRPRVFLLSTTHGAETHGLAAAMETMRVYQREPVIETMFERGDYLQQGLRQVIAAHQLEEQIQIIGKPCCLVFSTRDAAGNRCQGLRSLLLQELAKRGVIGPTLVISYAHTIEDIDRTFAAYDGALGIYRRALEDGFEKHLVGPASQVVYRRHNG